MIQADKYQQTDPLLTFEDLLEFIRGPGSDAARAALQGSKLMQINRDTFIVGKGTQVETRITRESAPVRKRLHNHDAFPLKQPLDSRFNAVHRSLIKRAKDSILNALQELLNIDPTGLNSPSENPTPALCAYTSPSLRQAVIAAAQAIANTKEFGYQRNPGTAGFQALHAFLGKKRVDEVCRIIGADATLGDLNLFNIHAKALRDTHKRNPNAAII